MDTKLSAAWRAITTIKPSEAAKYGPASRAAEALLTACLWFSAPAAAGSDAARDHASAGGTSAQLGVLSGTAQLTQTAGLRPSGAALGSPAAGSAARASLWQHPVAALKAAMSAAEHDQAVRREVSAAIESVLPRTALGAFVQLAPEQRIQQLEDAVAIVTGLRVVAWDADAGGVGIHNAPAEAAAAASTLEDELLEAVQHLRAQVDIYDSLCAQGLGVSHVLFGELINRRQLLSYVEALLEDVQGIIAANAVAVDTVSTALETVRSNTAGMAAVSKAKVYPHLQKLGSAWTAAGWSTLQLQAAAATWAAIAPHTAPECCSVNFETPPAPARAGTPISVPAPGGEDASALTVHNPRTNTQWAHVRLAFQGFCPVALARGQLHAGVPELGVAVLAPSAASTLGVPVRAGVDPSSAGVHLVASSETALERLQATPLAVVASALHAVRTRPELIVLLAMTGAFPRANLPALAAAHAAHIEQHAWGRPGVPADPVLQAQVGEPSTTFTHMQVASGIWDSTEPASAEGLADAGAGLADTVEAGELSAAAAPASQAQASGSPADAAAMYAGRTVTRAQAPSAASNGYTPAANHDDVVLSAGAKPGMVDASVSTPVHFTESNIVPGYTWNAWELRRRIVQVANIRKKATVGVQTQASHFKRDGTSQTWAPRDSETQTGISRGTAPPRQIRYMRGLRGGHVQPHMVTYSLEL